MVWYFHYLWSWFASLCKLILLKSEKIYKLQFRPTSTLLGQLPRTEIYVDKTHFKEAKEIPGIKIYQFSSALFFINRDYFKDDLLLKTLNLTCDDILDSSDPLRKLCQQLVTSTIIIDCSGMAYIDSSGVESILEVINLLKDMDIRCYLSSCPTPVLNMLERSNFFSKIPNGYSGLFPSVHDAVVHCYNMDIRNWPKLTPSTLNQNENFVNKCFQLQFQEQIIYFIKCWN